jgi:hypothetical protein
MKFTSLSKRNNLIRVIILLVASLLLTSCYSDYGLSSSDTDLVITQYQKTTDFSKFKTFAIVDSVYHLTGDPDEPDSEYLSRKNDAFILRTIVDNMKALGYTQVETPNSPDDIDVVIFVSAQGTKVDQYYTGGWWGGGYYPGWGWGYPGWGWGYPGYVGKTTYYVGTLFINYVDVNKIGDDVENVPVEWNATLNGLLDNASTTASQARLKDGIDEAFNQSSSYLSVSN